MEPKMHRARWLALWSACALAACSTPVHIPVVTPGARCGLPAAMQQACVAPTRLDEGLTYADLLKAYQGDRRALQECATRQQAAVKALGTCNVEIDRLNADLVKLNELAAANRP